jgi:DNA-3-methyladenine glycosylase
MTLLSRDFYIRPDVVTIARELLGKVLVTNIDGQLTSGIITETEAYAGATDKASHAFGGRRTERTEIMYRVGGTAYVYLCYGVHSLFNIVTNIENIPHAVLIRGIRPVDGIPEMLLRTGKALVNKNLANGPGKVSKALGIHYSHTGTDLVNGPVKASKKIWIEDRGVPVINSKILSTPRIGVEYAGEDAMLPYRFLVSV